LIPIAKHFSHKGKFILIYLFKIICQSDFLLSQFSQRLIVEDKLIVILEKKYKLIRDFKKEFGPFV